VEAFSFEELFSEITPSKVMCRIVLDEFSSASSFDSPASIAPIIPKKINAYIADTTIIAVKVGQNIFQ
jgi:hypothetical protein